MILKIMRYAIALMFGITGYMFSKSIYPMVQEYITWKQIHFSWLSVSMSEFLLPIVGSLIWFIIGLVLARLIINLGLKIIHGLERILNHWAGEDLLFGALGLAFGLIISNLIGLAFRDIPLVGPYIPVILSAILGYLGMDLMMRKRKDIFDYWYERIGNINHIARELNEVDKERKESNLPTIFPQLATPKSMKLLDTSVIIDGRIGDICHTGFLEGPLIVPVFVLEELQKISDSGDTLKRGKGRRGLDILKQMQDDPLVELILVNTDYEEIEGVDSKLMRLALDNNWKLITNDYNLNQVATLQNIKVLNLNELANAMKPVRIPGEVVNVQVIKLGKEREQGIAYLEDGTMIVIEKGKSFLNETIPVVVTSVLQTSAGRMIFAKPEGEQ